MSPRQVRAGVPRSLDDIADRLLGAPPRHHAAPISSAAGLSAALAGVIGHSHEPPSKISEERLSVGQEQRRRCRHSADPGGRDTARTGSARGPVRTDRCPADGVRGRPDQYRTAAGGRQLAHRPPGPASVPQRQPRRRERQRRQRRQWLWHHPPEEAGGTAWRLGRRILILLAILALLSVIAMAQFLIKPAVTGDDDDAGGDRPATTNTAPVSKVAKIVGARDVDPKPEGSGEEHREDVPKTYDGKQGTTWTTMSYSKANFGGEKPGVGIVYDLGSVVSISKVTVSLVREPYELELRVPSGDKAESPAHPTDWEAVAKAEDAGEETILEPAAGTQSRYVMIWLTKIPKEKGGDFRGEIAEVSIEEMTRDVTDAGQGPVPLLRCRVPRRPRPQTNHRRPGWTTWTTTSCCGCMSPATRTPSA